MVKKAYFSVMAGDLFGLDGYGSPTIGINLDIFGGWQFNRYFGIGGGVGIMSLGEHSSVPVYANIRSHFMKTSTTLYGDLNIGYGAFIGSNLSTIPGFKALGGLYARPAIGIRFKSCKKTHATLDLGYIFQAAKYDYQNFDGTPVEENRPFYGLSLRAGFVF